MVWNETTQGERLNNGWTAMQKLYILWLPQHKQSLKNLANRPIDG